MESLFDDLIVGCVWVLRCLKFGCYWKFYPHVLVESLSDDLIVGCFWVLGVLIN